MFKFKRGQVLQNPYQMIVLEMVQAIPSDTDVSVVGGTGAVGKPGYLCWARCLDPSGSYKADADDAVKDTMKCATVSNGLSENLQWVEQSQVERWKEV